MFDSALDLQRTMAALILEPDADESFGRDPEGFGARWHLPPADTAALLRFKDRLALYRDLGRANLEEAVENIFPITQAVLGDAWDECIAAFLANRNLTTPFYRDIAPTFVEWLGSSRWGLDRWPFLLPMAHFEFVEVMVLRSPTEPPVESLDTEPTPNCRLVLNGATQVMNYAFAVHKANQEFPVPEELPTYLLAYRDAGDEFQVLELTPATAALMVRGQEETLSLAANSLGLSDLDEALSLLKDLAARGAIRGFR